MHVCIYTQSPLQRHLFLICVTSAKNTSEGVEAQINTKHWNGVHAGDAKFIYQSICLSIYHLSFYLSIVLSIYRSIYLSLYLSIVLSFVLSFVLSVVHLPFFIHCINLFFVHFISSVVLSFCPFFVYLTILIFFSELWDINLQFWLSFFRIVSLYFAIVNFFLRIAS